jgi:hypothetical protein
VTLAYNDAMSNYIDAATNYQSKRIQALVATGQPGAQAVADFQFNAENYYLKVKAANDRWTNQGYRNEVDEMNAYINGVTQRSMVLWRQRLQELYERATITDVDSNTPFKYTTIIPGNFANAGGWTNYSFYHEMINTTSNYSSSSWGGGGGVNFGLWRASASVQNSTQQSSSSVNISNFRMSFDLVQAVITRPWFYPEFFINRGWTLQKGAGWMFDEYPSDGAGVPRGNFIGYPTQAIFARNLVIESDDFASAYEQHSKSFSASASGGWGPFTINGNYSKASGGTSFNLNRQGARISVPGMQIIAFISHLIPKAPNPLPDIPAASFQ